MAKLLLVGCGKMGGAMLEGWLERSLDRLCERRNHDREHQKSDRYEYRKADREKIELRTHPSENCLRRIEHEIQHDYGQR